VFKENMSVSPADIFLGAHDASSFRGSIRALEGRFDFDSGAMIALGTAYFHKFPDRGQNRNMEEVRLGYELVRICAVEKMILVLPEARKELYRSALSNVAAVDELSTSIGVDVLAEDVARLGAALDDIKRTIDEIPKGMIKERFVGGVTALFNILYLFKLKVRPPAS
jgi:hypothetical protein